MLTRARIPGLFLGLLSPFLGAAEPPADLAALAATQQGLATIQGTFTWTVLKEGGSTPRLGEFAIDRSSGTTRYHLRMAEADGANVLRLCFDGQRSWVVEQLVPETEPDVREQDSPDARRVVACILLDLPTLEREFTIDYRPGVLALTPRDAALARTLASIRVTLEGADPTEVAIEDPQDGRIRITLGAVRRGEPVPELFFRVR
jgi:outer membrane lipoprotein-sorting protein